MSSTVPIEGGSQWFARAIGLTGVPATKQVLGSLMRRKRHAVLIYGF
jgi:hypothetical protein